MMTASLRYQRLYTSFRQSATTSPPTLLLACLTETGFCFNEQKPFNS